MGRMMKLRLMLAACLVASAVGQAIAQGDMSAQMKDAIVSFDSPAVKARGRKLQAAKDACLKKVARALRARQAKTNVILLTLDGVRYQEFFASADVSVDPNASAVKALPLFWSWMAPNGVVLGDPKQGSVMTISNTAYISLPAYFSIMAGSTQPCWTNDCKRTAVETLPERIKRELGLKTEAVAVIASWDKIADAAEHVAGAVHVKAGKWKASDRAWHDGTPYDDLTFPRAMDYLMRNKPRFMFISLNDSDAWAHEGKYPQYLASLRQYDKWMSMLLGTLSSLGEYGKNTTLIITTDHGRGSGPEDWKHHTDVKEAKDVWFYAAGPGVKRRGSVAGVQAYEHADIRPTVEALFGLVPCEGCTGKVISEVVSPVTLDACGS